MSPAVRCAHQTLPAWRGWGPGVSRSAVGGAGSGGQGSEEALTSQGGQRPAPGLEQDPKAADLSGLSLTLPAPLSLFPRGNRLGRLGSRGPGAACRRFSMQLLTELLLINGHKEHGLL